MIADPNNEILISPASYWETAIKESIGKYPLSVPYETFITQGVDGNATTVSTASTAYRNQAAARSALVAIWRSVRDLPDRCQTGRYEEHRQSERERNPVNRTVGRPSGDPG